ncbi:hypothetical protein [Comamonas terrigena]|nr:hypothetical protein [Comamonas terrigena]MDH0513768.1 hypothetical protein [Comamonas terrigena]MDH1503224.1 hypothetical protein [Comamonas terrigena]
MNQFFTAVLQRPTEPAALKRYTQALESLRPFLTASALGDAISLLEQIEEHEDFDNRIADAARDRLGMHGC